MRIIYAARAKRKPDAETIWLTPERGFALQPLETLNLHGVWRAQQDLPNAVAQMPHLAAEFPLIPELYGSGRAVLEVFISRLGQMATGERTLYPYVIRGREFGFSGRQMPVTGMASLVRWQDQGELPKCIDPAIPHVEASFWLGPSHTAKEARLLFEGLLSVLGERGIPGHKPDWVAEEQCQIFSVSMCGDDTKETGLQRAGFGMQVPERVSVGGQQPLPRNIWLYGA